LTEVSFRPLQPRSLTSRSLPSASTAGYNVQHAIGRFHLIVRSLTGSKSWNIRNSLMTISPDAVATRLLGLSPAALKLCSACPQANALLFAGPTGHGKDIHSTEFLQRLSPRSVTATHCSVSSSYQYEAFIQGIRPPPWTAGRLQYEMHRGRFTHHGSAPSEQPRSRFVLILRAQFGEMSRVFFGELNLRDRISSTRECLASFVGRAKDFYMPANLLLLRP